MWLVSDSTGHSAMSKGFWKLQHLPVYLGAYTEPDSGLTFKRNSAYIHTHRHLVIVSTFVPVAPFWILESVYKSLSSRALALTSRHYVACCLVSKTNTLKFWTTSRFADTTHCCYIRLGQMHAKLRCFIYKFETGLVRTPTYLHYPDISVNLLCIILDCIATGHLFFLIHNWHIHWRICK